MIIKISAALATDTLTDITGGGIEVDGTYVMTLVHRGQYGGWVSMAVTDGSDPTDADWIEWRARLAVMSDVLSRHPIPLAAGMCVYLLTNVAGVSVSLFGREE